MIVWHGNKINTRIVIDNTQFCFEMYSFNKIDEKLRLSQYSSHLLFNSNFIEASHCIDRLSLGLYCHLSLILLISFHFHLRT